jgi:hypothetical protein
MSQMGQSQPNWAARAMSGLPPIATVLRTSQVVRFVPMGDIVLSPCRRWLGACRLSEPKRPFRLGRGLSKSRQSASRIAVAIL